MNKEMFLISDDLRQEIVNLLGEFPLKHGFNIVLQLSNLKKLPLKPEEKNDEASAKDLKKEDKK